MTIGENIRRIRKLRGIPVKELAERLGISETYMRYYENNVRHPKKDGILRIAEALNVNPEVLQASDIDPVTAMHRLFHVFTAFDGKMKTAGNIADGIKDKSLSPDDVYIDFHALQPHLSSWLVAYADYMSAISKAEQIPNPVDKANAILDAQKSFDLWMDFYPDSEA